MPFTKNLVLHVGHACADLEGKEVGKGGGGMGMGIGIGRTPPGKLKFLKST